MLASLLAIAVFVPGNARAEDLGNPDVVLSRNTGDTGAISVFYDVPANSAGTARTIEAHCGFQFSPAVNSNSITVGVTGTAIAHRSDVGSAAATGIRCELRSDTGTTVVESAVPGSVATADTVVGLRLATMTLCVSASVLWADDVYQEMRTPACVPAAV